MINKLKRPCPCGSSKRAIDCCWDGIDWNKNQKTLPSSETGISHPQCYASKTNGCHSKISREHFISNNILRGFDKNGKVKITGLPWQHEGTFNLLSRESLVSKILCKKHNELLSPFDTAAGKLHTIIGKYDQSMRAPSPTNEFSLFSGKDIERWMLKTVCAFIASNQIAIDETRVECQLKEIYIDILYRNREFPDKWGMYLEVPVNKRFHHFPSFQFSPRVANGEVLAADFFINNLKFTLLLGKPDKPEAFGIYRPRGIAMRLGNISKEIEFSWQDSRYNQALYLTLSGTSKEYPSNWPDKFKK